MDEFDVYACGGCARKFKIKKGATRLPECPACKGTLRPSTNEGSTIIRKAAILDESKKEGTGTKSRNEGTSVSVAKREGTAVNIKKEATATAEKREGTGKIQKREGTGTIQKKDVTTTAEKKEGTGFKKREGTGTKVATKDGTAIKTQQPAPPKKSKAILIMAEVAGVILIGAAIFFFMGPGKGGKPNKGNQASNADSQAKPKTEKEKFVEAAGDRDKALGKAIEELDYKQFEELFNGYCEQADKLKIDAASYDHPVNQRTDCIRRLRKGAEDKAKALADKEDLKQATAVLAGYLAFAEKYDTDENRKLTSGISKRIGDIRYDFGRKWKDDVEAFESDATKWLEEGKTADVASKAKEKIEAIKKVVQGDADLEKEVSDPLDRLTDLVKKAEGSKSFEGVYSQASSLISSNQFDDARKLLDPYTNDENPEVSRKATDLYNKASIGWVFDKTKKKLSERVSNNSKAKQELEKVKNQVNQARKDELALGEKIKKVLTEKYGSTPFEYSIKGEAPIMADKVLDYKDEIIVFQGANGKIPLSINLLDPLTVARMLTLAGASTAKEQYSLMKEYARGFDFESAKAAFEKAVAQDSSLDKFRPDFSNVLKKNSIKERITFRNGRLMVEFKGEVDGLKGASLTDKKSIKVSGSGEFVADFEKVKWEGCSVFLFVSEAETKAEEIVCGVKSGGDFVKVYASKSGGKLEDASGRSEKFRCDAPKSIYLLLEGETARVLVNGAVVYDGKVLAVASPVPFFGAKGGSEAAFSVVRIAGPAKGGWYDSTITPVETALEKEINKEFKIENKQDDDANYYESTLIDEVAEDLPIHIRDEESGGDLSFKKNSLSREIDGILKHSSDAANLVKSLDKMQKILGDYPLLLLYKAMAHFAAGERDKAAESYSKVSNEFGDFAEARAYYSQFLVQVRNYKAAKEQAEKALEIAPDCAVAHAEYANLQMRMKKFDEALFSIEVAEQMAPQNGRIKSLKRLIRNVARGAFWSDREVQVETQHYYFRGDIEESRLKYYAQCLEGARGYYESWSKMAPDASLEKPTVMIFRSREGYDTYTEYMGTAEPMSVGMFVPSVNQLMFYESGTETLNTMYHEGFHHFLSMFAFFAPTWFNEGTAEYVSGIEVDPASKKIQKSGKPLYGRLQNLLYFIGEARDFDQFMKWSQGQYYTQNPFLNYAQGWAMVHFFMHYDNGKYADNYWRYFRVIFSGGRADDAFKAGFDGVDFIKMKQEWEQYVRNLK